MAETSTEREPEVTSATSAETGAPDDEGETSGGITRVLTEKTGSRMLQAP